MTGKGSTRVEQAQIEELVGEIETRVDRLRSLYEQYFMGIEKMEPHVPKKDVERRFQLLRKEQIRNTALRFRFHMILQKYNTYQSYWLRTMRQIEDGTYKRDLLRARNNQALRRSAPPPKPVEVEVARTEATPTLDDFEFDTDLPTRQVDVPALRAKEATRESFAAEDATTRVVNRLGAGFDEDPTALYLPVVDAKMAAPSPAVPPTKAPIARVRLAQADPDKLRALAALIIAKKTDGEPTAPPRRLVAEAPPIHQPPVGSSPDLTAKKPGPPPLKPLTSPGGFRPLAPPLDAKPATPPVPMVLKPAPAAPARPGPPPLIRPAIKPPTPAVAAPPPLAPKPPPLPLNRPPTAPGAFKPLAPPMNNPPAPAAAPKAAAGPGAAELKKHGKSPDFEVTVKDGKTILRPVVK